MRAYQKCSAQKNRNQATPKRPAGARRRRLAGVMCIVTLLAFAVSVHASGSVIQERIGPSQAPLRFAVLSDLHYYDTLGMMLWGFWLDVPPGDSQLVQYLN